MPAAAKLHTTAGALAFAKFFIQTIDWGYATTSSTYMRHYFQPSCELCASIARSLDITAQRGHYFIGDRFIRLTTRSLNPVKASDAAARVQFDVTAYEVADAHDNAITGHQAIANYGEEVQLAWRTTQWAVITMTATFG
jgi:predicted DCC family thiol-disulfide oxidoreductase YuxK